MGYNATREYQSFVFPGVKLHLRKMTEGRRLELRKILSGPNQKIHDLLRQQTEIEKVDEPQRDTLKLFMLQDEIDGLLMEIVNPAWLTWGVKGIEGLVVDGKSLSVVDWADWPSALYTEAIAAVKAEAELNGEERKNSELLTISGEPGDGKQNPSTVASVSDADSGAAGTV